MNVLKTISHKLFAVLSIAVIILSVLPVQNAAAADKRLCPNGMSKLDCDSITGNWTGWVPGNAICTADGASADPSLTSQDSQKNQEIVYNFFLGKHYQPYQAAAIVGNMITESSVMPQRLQGTAEKQVTTAEDYVARYPNGSKNDPGWGITQWTPGVKFINNVSSVSAANTLGTQMQFVSDQLDGKTPIPERQAGIDIKAAPDIREAVLAFQGNRSVGGKYVGYERPADQSGSVEQRLSNAKSVLTKYGSGNPSADLSATVVSDPCAGGVGGDAAGGATVGDGKYALPLPQKLFDQYPERFNGPHHGGAIGGASGGKPAVDIMTARGTPVYAALSGKIIYAPASNYDTCYGRGVIIQTKDPAGDIFTIYGHGYDGGTIPGAKQGDTVHAGQLIMHVDSEGYNSRSGLSCSSGDHLHFDFATPTITSHICPQSWLMAVGRKQTPPDVHSLPKTGCVS